MANPSKQTRTQIDVRAGLSIFDSQQQKTFQSRRNHGISPQLSLRSRGAPVIHSPWTTHPSAFTGDDAGNRKAGYLRASAIRAIRIQPVCYRTGCLPACIDEVGGAVLHLR